MNLVEELVDRSSYFSAKEELFDTIENIICNFAFDSELEVTVPCGEEKYKLLYVGGSTYMAGSVGYDNPFLSWEDNIEHMLLFAKYLPALYEACEKAQAERDKLVVTTDHVNEARMKSAVNLLNKWRNPNLGREFVRNSK